MLIRTKCDLRFNGAKTGRPFRLRRNVVTEMDENEIPHLDPKDYKVLASGTPGQLLLDLEDIPRWLMKKMGTGADAAGHEHN